MGKPVLNVTAAIIYNDDKFLICQLPKMLLPVAVKKYGGIATRDTNGKHQSAMWLVKVADAHTVQGKKGAKSE